jgi:hypothetical protein
LQKSAKSFYVLFICLTVVFIFWIALLHVYPFVDLPNHLLLATIHKFYNSVNEFQEFFEFTSLLRSNTFHFFFVQLPVFPAIELGNKIFYMLYVTLLPFSVLLLINKIGGNKWFALLSFILVFNFNVIWGFVGFTIAIPAVLFFLLFMIDFFEKPKLIYVLLMMISLLVIFFIHFQAALFCMFMLGAAVIYDYKNIIKNLAKKIIIVTPAIILMITAWQGAKTNYHESLSSYLLNYYSSKYFLTLHYRIKDFFIFDNSFLFEKAVGWIVAALLSVFILSPLVIYMYKNFREFRQKLKMNLNIYPLIFLICSLLCYLFLPNDIPGQSMVYERFSVYVLLAVILISSVVIPERVTKKLTRWIVILTVIYTVVLSQYFYDFRKDSTVFTEQILPDKDTGVLAALIYDYEFRGTPVYIHYHTYYTTWKQGISTNGWTDYRFSFMRRNVPMEKLPSHIAWVQRINPYNNEYKDVDHLLVKDDTVRTFENMKLVKRSGDWMLYEKDTIP